MRSVALWNRLRSRAINDCKFVRQEPIGPYVVDFVRREHRLIIEVDGGQHADNKRDRLRDQWLAERNYRGVLRERGAEKHEWGARSDRTGVERGETPHPPAFGGRPLPASGER